MNREKFIKELEFLLQDISMEEREEALAYYNDYFDEAGIENEEAVINDLQSPEKVAALIKAGLDSTFEDSIGYGDHGVFNEGYQNNHEVVEAKVVDKKDRINNFNGIASRNRILLIVIAILLVLVILPVGGTLGGLIAGFFVMVLVLALLSVGGSIACLAGAVVCLVMVVKNISSYPGVGLLFLSGVFGFIALSYVTTLLAKGIFKIFPMIIRGIVDVVKKLVAKVGGSDENI